MGTDYVRSMRYHCTLNSSRTNFVASYCCCESTQIEKLKTRIVFQESESKESVISGSEKGVFANSVQSTNETNSLSSSFSEDNHSDHDRQIVDCKYGGADNGTQRAESAEDSGTGHGKTAMSSSQ